MKKEITLLSIFIFYLFGNSISQTNIYDKQEIYGNWTKANSPYTIKGQAIVPVGKILNIEPGVVVKFSGDENGSMLVQGKLNAIGTLSDWVVFTRLTDKTWKGIYFEKTLENNNLAFCKIEYSDYPNYGSNYGAIGIEKSNVKIQNCIISNNLGVGIHYIETGDQYIDHCTFIDNGNTAIYAPTQSNPIVKNSIFWGSPRSFDSPATVSYSLLSESSIPGKVTDRGNNLYGIDPQFVNYKGGDYHLGAYSPCLKKGENGTDLGAYSGSSISSYNSSNFISSSLNATNPAKTGTYKR